MLFVEALHWEHTVALLAEGVDRNSQTGSWDDTSRQVALLAEGVDRNLFSWLFYALSVCRPPRGGRG